jgi:hypothetical protein
MLKKKTQTTHMFYSVSTCRGQAWASEIEPISSMKAKRCMSCGRTGGIFFRDCGPFWDPYEPITVRTATQTIQCYACWLSDDGPFFIVDKKGKTHQPDRCTIMFARDRNELVELISAWKNGQNLRRDIETPYGTVIAFASLDNKPKGHDYSLKCPHCEKLISLTIAQE